ncbi:hypothetical protein MKEN_00504500 [Mycena kentingensis (nom. inval.)]|nr:hypothetical protein MKEN_00504500 [Mycena kentingensis (nom. inval.)]
MDTPPSSPSRPTKRTLDWSELAPWQRDNPGILTGYRRLTNSWIGCLNSLGWWHNETVNIWSHLLGAGVVLVSSTALFILRDASKLFWLHLPASAQSEKTLLATFLTGAAVCFVTSAAFHASICHSQPVAKYMNRVDYFGILVLGTVNYFPTFHYAFYCAPTLRNLYIAMMTVSGSTGIYLACSPRYASPEYRRMRTYTFFSCGGVVILPFIHAMWRNGLQEANCAISFNWILAEAAFYVGGALLYSERFPECRWPGRFDIFGSSHQIFHVCSLLAVWAHYKSVESSFHYRHAVRGGTLMIPKRMLDEWPKYCARVIPSDAMFRIAPAEKEELRPENHPLMRPGAMPRKVAAMVTEGLVDGDEEDGEDELNK